MAHIYRLYAGEDTFELTHETEYSHDEFDEFIKQIAPSIMDAFFAEREFRYERVEGYGNHIHRLKPGDLYSCDIIEFIYHYLLKHHGFKRYQSPASTAGIDLCDGVFGGMLRKYNHRQFDEGDANANQMYNEITDSVARTVYNECRKHLEQINVVTVNPKDL